MNIKIRSLLCVALLCFLLVGCGDNNVKRPVDCPDSKWTCSSANITFSVSQDGKVTDATMVNKNGETVDISLVFTNEDKVSITNADGTETYITGTFSYEKDMFSVMVTDIYNPELEISSTRLVFKRSK